MANEFDIEKVFKDTQENLDQKKILESINTMKENAFILFNTNKLLSTSENLALVQDIFYQTLGRRMDALASVWFEMWEKKNGIDQH